MMKTLEVYMMNISQEKKELNLNERIQIAISLCST